MNCVFATNSDFIIPISLNPDGLDLKYVKLWILLDQIILVDPFKKFESVAKTQLVE